MQSLRIQLQDSIREHLRRFTAAVANFNMSTTGFF